MRVTPNAVRNNWQYNFVMVAMLFFWLVLAGIVLLNPKDATRFVGRMGNFKNLSPWPLAAMSFVPAFMLALPFAMVGRIMGIATASRILSGGADQPGAGDFSSLRFTGASASGGRRLQSEQWQQQPRTPSAAPDPVPPSPTGGSGIGRIFLRIVFGVLYMVGFFVLGSFTITAIVMAMENGDQEARRLAAESAGRASGVPLFFGSIGLVVVLAILGVLPGFRRRKAASPTNEAAPAGPKLSDSRVIAGR
jgi:hypothetical protein